MPNHPIRAAAEGLPAVQTATEDPHDRARRLMKELSETLNDCFSGKWGAEVYPARVASSVNGPVGFFNIRSQLGAWYRGRRGEGYLKRLRRMTPDERVEHHFKRMSRAVNLRDANKGPKSAEGSSKIDQYAAQDFEPWPKTVDPDAFTPPSNSDWNQYGNDELPQLRLAFLTMFKTKDELVQMLREDEDESLMEMAKDWTRGAAFFAELGKVSALLEAAHARMLVAAAAYAQSEAA